MIITTPDKPKISRPFSLKIGEATSTQIQPWEVLFFMPNPGEPHLDSDLIVEEASGFDGVYSFNFRRNLITIDPPALRYNECGIAAGEIAQKEAEFVRRSILLRWDLPSSIFTDVRDKKTIARLKSFYRVENLGSEEFLGHNATKYRLISPKEGTRTEDSSITTLIATQPSFQVLQHLEVTGPRFNDESGIDDFDKAFLKSRSIKELTIFNSWLVPTRTEYSMEMLNGGNRKYEVTIRNAATLAAPIDWFFNQGNLPGTEFFGVAEKANRKGTKRKTYFHTKDVSYLPFTKEEQSKIDKYLLSTNPTMRTEPSSISFLFWTGAATVITALIGAFAWRHLRRGCDRFSNELLSMRRECFHKIWC